MKDQSKSLLNLQPHQGTLGLKKQKGKFLKNEKLLSRKLLLGQQNCQTLLRKLHL